MQPMIAQAATEAASLAPWANLTAQGALICVVLWLVTKAFPALLERHDAAQTQAREHFEKILDKVETRRGEAAKDGHDAARKLAEAVSGQVAAINGNSTAINDLAREVKLSHGV